LIASNRHRRSAHGGAACLYLSDGSALSLHGSGLPDAHFLAPGRHPQTDLVDGHRVVPWGAPRIHGELLKLGIEQISVAKYWQGIENPSQGWKTFLRNHTDGMPQWIFSSFRHSRFDCFTACSSYTTGTVKSYGWQ
jgi:hypothetical protein